MSRKSIVGILARMLPGALVAVLLGWALVPALSGPETVRAGEPAAWSAETGFVTAGTTYGWELQDVPLWDSDLDAVWGSSPADVFVVGDGGVIGHYDGEVLISMQSGTSKDLRSVWGSCSSNVFAVGDGSAIIHYDGSRWTAVAVDAKGDFKAIWGSSSTNVFVAGCGMDGSGNQRGLILHFDGSAWSVLPWDGGSCLLGLWGSSATDAFAVGSGGAILHYDGSSWSPMASGTMATLNGVWGSSGWDVFAVGRDAASNVSVILHCDGSSWQPMSYGGYRLNAVWGTSSCDVIGVGDGHHTLRYNGSAWSAEWLFYGPYMGLWGDTSGGIFAVGTHGRMFKSTDGGRSWGALSGSQSDDLVSLWGDSASNIWGIGASGALVHYDGASWGLADCGALYGADSWLVFHDLWGVSSSGLVVSGEYPGFCPDDRLAWIWRYDGGTWTNTHPSGRSSCLYGVWCTSSTDITAVGFASDFIPYEDGYGPRHGLVLHWDGAAWSRTAIDGTGALMDVWGDPSSNVFVVGEDGVILHSEGEGWERMDSGTAQCLRAVWGSSASDVFAVGEAGAILHYDGSAWTQMASGTCNNLSGIWGISSSNVFAVGESGTILHYDGNAWTAMSSGTTSHLRAVWGASDTDVFAVGGGVILQYGPDPAVAPPSGGTAPIEDEPCGSGDAGTAPAATADNAGPGANGPAIPGADNVEPAPYSASPQATAISPETAAAEPEEIGNGDTPAQTRLWLYPVAVVGGFLALAAMGSLAAWLRGRTLG